MDLGSRLAVRFATILPVLTYLPVFPRCSSLSASGGRNVYFEKIRVLKAGVAFIGVRPNNVAWNNGIGPRFYFVGLKDLR